MAHAGPLADRLERFLDEAARIGPPVGTRGARQRLEQLGLLSLLGEDAPRLPAGFLQTFADPALEAWGLRMAAAILLDLEPARVVRALEGKREAAAGTRFGNTEPAQNMALWLRTVFWVVHERLGIERNDALQRAMVESPVPLLRLVGLHHLAQASGETPYPRYSPQEALALLDGLDDAGRRRTLSVEWLRWLRANTPPQSRGHPRLVALRRALLDRVTATLEAARVPQEVDLVLRSLEGAEPGDDARTLHEEWLAGLVAAGRLSADDEAGLWLARLRGRLETFLPSRLLEVGADHHPHFREGVDDELTVVAVDAALAASPAARARVSRDLGELVGRGLCVLRLPWALGRFFTPYDSASRGLVWVAHVLDLLELRADEGGERWWESLRAELGGLDLDELARANPRGEDALFHAFWRARAWLRERQSPP